MRRTKNPHVYQGTLGAAWNISTEAIANWLVQLNQFRFHDELVLWARLEEKYYKTHKYSSLPIFPVIYNSSSGSFCPPIPHLFYRLSSPVRFHLPWWDCPCLLRSGRGERQRKHKSAHPNTQDCQDSNITYEER